MSKKVISDLKTVFLRKFHKEDAVDLFHALGDKRVVRHLATEGITLQDCEDIITDAEVHWHEHKMGSYAVVDKATNKIVGWAGFKLWKTLDQLERQFEIVIVLSPSVWGWGKDLCQLLLKRAKEDFSLKRIYVLLPETRRSFKWIEKMGFSICEKEVFNDELFYKFVKNL